MSPALVRTVLLSCALAAGGASLYQVGAKSSHPHHAPDIPSSPKPGPARGEVISAEALNAAAALPSAARNYLVHYDSRSPDGSDVVVSGTVAIPAGNPPAGGWPLITWTHGTTGFAPECAPTWARLDSDLAFERVAIDLSGARLRQFVDELDLPWIFVR